MKKQVKFFFQFPCVHYSFPTACWLFYKNCQSKVILEIQGASRLYIFFFEIVAEYLLYLNFIFKEEVSIFFYCLAFMSLSLLQLCVGYAMSFEFVDGGS